MDHVAILRKSCVKTGDNLLQDIVDGTKTIDSRWYVNRIAPWDRIEAGDRVYFKESGEPVTAQAKVSKVIQYNNLNKENLEKIILEYSQKISPNTTKEQFSKWIKTQKKKRYCILVFIENVQEIKSFNIDKTGYGISCAWLVTNNINKIKAK